MGVATQSQEQTTGGQDAQWVSMFKADQKIVPRSVTGRFARARWAMVLFTQALFYGLAWVQTNNRQFMLFDLSARRFYLGPLVFYPQDFIYLTGLLVVCALSLFLFTAVAGRVWCGYACPQTVYTELFMAIERWAEGDRSARLRLAAGPWTLERVRRTGTKQLGWVALALWTGFTFVGYFTPIRTLWHSLVTLSVSGWEGFWIGFYSLATYGNAGFMREQVCKYMCPYARFQSAMFDRDTLLVTYDEQRGEPRGARSKKADPSAIGLGSCVDCSLCVQVCPTGIDIRKGLQYECIGCAACVDVCDQVMDKMGYARGLVRYSTQNGVAKGWDTRTLLKRALRPRVLVYSAVVWALIIGLLTTLALRPDIRADVVRDRAVNARVLDNGELENVYRINLMNDTEQAVQVHVAVGPATQFHSPDTGPTVLAPTESHWVVVHVQAREEAVQPGSNPLTFRISSQRLGDGARGQVDEHAVFLAPR